MRHRDRLADLDVVERRVRVVHAHVEDVEALARVELEGRVVLDRLEVRRAGVVDAVGVAGLQLDEALGGLGAPLEDDLVDLGRLAPEGRAGLERDVVALDPLLELVGAGPVRLADDRAVGGSLLEVGRVIDREGAERHLREERGVRSAEAELDGQGVDRLDRLDHAGVGLAVVGLGLAVDLGGGRVGHGLERRRAGRLGGAPRWGPGWVSPSRRRPRPGSRSWHQGRRVGRATEFRACSLDLLFSVPGGGRSHANGNPLSPRVTRVRASLAPAMARRHPRMQYAARAVPVRTAGPSG